MRLLFLLRHAEAAFHDGADFDRSLTPHGQTQADKVAALLISGEHKPDLLVHSTARRVFETIQPIRNRLAGIACEGKQSLYNAGVEALLATVRDTPDDFHAILIAAHNPGIGQLARFLADDAAPDAYPPAGLTILRCDIERWTRIAPKDCQLERFYAPD